MTKYPVKFTLTEMLVVIAIISILAALLMPGLKNALDGARAISCKNNLRQVGYAVSGYADANNQWLPPAVDNRWWSLQWQMDYTWVKYLCETGLLAYGSGGWFVKYKAPLLQCPSRSYPSSNSTQLWNYNPSRFLFGTLPLTSSPSGQK